MRLEYIPVVLGALVLLVAAGIIFDAAAPEARRPFRERRRRQRAEIDTAGEWLVGFGIACLGISMIGNEVWRWTTIVVISGVVLILIGALMNKDYLREVLLFRGIARRGDGKEIPRNESFKLRIR
jgi:cell division protein FtsW (lipid II flippase)